MSQQVAVDEHRAGLQEAHAWLEKMTRGVESLEAGSGCLVAERLQVVKGLAEEYADRGPALIASTKERGEALARDVGEMDRQHLQEQVASVERRVADVKKRIDRKQQILKMAKEGFDETRDEIEATDRWMKEKINWLQEVLPTIETDKRVEEVAALTKETDSKNLLLESLENKVQAIGLDLEPSERQELQNYLRMMAANQAILSKLTKEVLKQEQQMAEHRKRADEDSAVISTWLKAQHAEVLTSPDYDPLAASDVEKKATRLKKADGELRAYEESNMATLRKNIQSLSKSEKSDARPLAKELKAVENAFEDFKVKLKARIVDLEGKHEGRKNFEGGAESVFSWLSKAESAVANEMRGTVNIATLDDHLQRFKTLRKEEEEMRELLAKLVGEANAMLPSLSDADRLTLQSRMDGLCDKMNHVTAAAAKRVEDLVKNIEHYRQTASKIEESVVQLGDIQREIKLLNKPIGHRVEDAEDVLASYEKILGDLKRFKGQLEDLHRTAGTNVSELRALLLQQEELILAIENQMVRIRALISLRHGFMEIVTGITGFIIKYTEVVKEVERSNLSPSEKVKRYDEVLSKISECDAQLELAVDKGEQIAAEGSAQDRNKITEQLQSLKSQLQTLRRAIEKKRAEHVHTAEEHQRLAGEAEALLDRLAAREGEVKTRPLLATDVDDVEAKLADHGRLSDEVGADLQKVAAIRDAAAKEENIPGSVASVLNHANALLHTMPQQLEERKQYLESNKELRLQYDSLVERLNNWVEEAQLKLRPYEAGVDFANLENDLEEHRRYFSEETKLRDLLDKIHDKANKIWASLDVTDQEKLAHEQEFFNQLVKNTLNSAHIRQAELEENFKKWKELREAHAKAAAAASAVSPREHERPSTLAGVKSVIARVDAAIRKAQPLRDDVEAYNDLAREIAPKADVINRTHLAEEGEGLNQALKRGAEDLRLQKEELASLALAWEDFEVKARGFNSNVGSIHQKLADVDAIFRSLPQMKETKAKLKVSFWHLIPFSSKHIQILRFLRSNCTTRLCAWRADTRTSWCWPRT